MWITKEKEYMGVAPKENTKRNKELVKDKKTMTFPQLAAKYKISEARVKEIYYREIKKKS